MKSSAIALSPPRDDARAPGLVGLAEAGWLPDPLLRVGIRRLCARRLESERAGGIEAQAARMQQRLELLRSSPVAIHIAAANAQHYELPTEFFRLCLGPRLKYSACLFEGGDETLAQAEEAMLELYGERAGLGDGQDILELGCGWGSLTLWMAERYPGARITAVTNSRTQREHIEAECRRREFDNVVVRVQDVSRVEFEVGCFDRVVSVEMFEHIRNYDLLMHSIGRWLRRGGRLFVHIFCHREHLYPFETEGAGNWMGRHFFTGGLMPSADTLLWFQRGLRIERRWLLDGAHYRHTANRWLEQQDHNRDAALATLGRAYGVDRAPLWFHRWRMFWMACAETFGYGNGQEWLVAHYRFVREA